MDIPLHRVVVVEKVWRFPHWVVVLLVDLVAVDIPLHRVVVVEKVWRFPDWVVVLLVDLDPVHGHLVDSDLCSP